MQTIETITSAGPICTLIQCLSCLSAASLDDAQIRLLLFWLRHATTLAIWKARAFYVTWQFRLLPLADGDAPRHCY